MLVILRPTLKLSSDKLYKGLPIPRYKMVNVTKEPESKFIKIRCPKCKNEQIMFGKASTVVNCLVCGKQLATPSGGRAKVKARVLEVLE